MNAGLPEWVATEAQDYVRRASAHAELKRWLAGDHHNNNPVRAEEAA